MNQNQVDNIPIYRIAAGMWIFYLIALVVVDGIIYADIPGSPVVVYSWANALTATLFLGLSFWKWGQAQLKNSYPLLMILLITISPILYHHLLLPKLPAGPLSNAEGMTLRQWPIHFMGLVLVAWQYRLGPVFIFSLGTAALDLGIILLFKPANPGTFTILAFINLIRTVSFLVVGIFIQQLMTRLRSQQASLHRANLQIRDYASTLENLTISRERNRMARELHDTLAHTLSALSVQLETIKAYWAVEPKTAQNLLDQALTATRSGLDETRRSLKALRASPLEDLGLGLALHKLADSARERANLKLIVQMPEIIPALSPDSEQCIYRVSQEAIENVIHHANAHNLQVELNFNKNECVLEVQDDGLGFDLGNAVQPGHFGLSGMQERAHLVGGKLTIDSRPKAGTKIKLSLPPPKTLKGNENFADGR
jgi:signal transduction histidine kinase